MFARAGIHTTRLTPGKRRTTRYGANIWERVAGRDMASERGMGIPFRPDGTAHGPRSCSGLALPPSDAVGHQGNGVADGSTSQVSPRPLHAVGGPSADKRTLSLRRRSASLTDCSRPYRRRLSGLRCEMCGQLSSRSPANVAVSGACERNGTCCQVGGRSTPNPISTPRYSMGRLAVAGSSRHAVSVASVISMYAGVRYSCVRIGFTVRRVPRRV